MDMEQPEHGQKKLQSSDLADGEHNRPDPRSRFKYLILLTASGAVIYLLNRWLFQIAYVGDLLALPVYLPLSLYLAQRLNLASQQFKFRFRHILMAVVLFAAIFEGLLPSINVGATRDPWDILAYFGGGLIVYCVQYYSSKQQIS